MAIFFELWIFPNFVLKLKNFLNFKTAQKHLSRSFKYLMAILVILEVKGILFILKLWGALWSLCRFYVVFWLLQKFMDISVILEALVVIIGYLLVFIDIWESIQRHASIMLQIQIQSFTIILKEWILRLGLCERG